MSRSEDVTSTIRADSTLDDELEPLEQLRLRGQHVDRPNADRVGGEFLLARVRAEPVGLAAVDLDGNALALAVVAPFEDDLLRETGRSADRGAPGVSPSIVCVTRASVTARPAAGTWARIAQNRSGTAIMPVTQAIRVRQRGNEYSDNGKVSSSQPPTASSEIGSACSSGTSSTIGNTTSAAIQLQNAWNDMRRAARGAMTRS
jgi:hypothetical protein